MDSQREVVPEVLSGIASVHVCSLASAKATGTGCAPMEQEKKDVVCHPIATQAAGDSTHGRHVAVHAFKRSSRKGKRSCVWPVGLKKTFEKSEKTSAAAE